MSELPEVGCCGEDSECYVPLAGLMDVLSKKYSMRVICVVGAHDSIRFNEIKEHLSTASTSTLSNRLEELVEEDLLERTRFDEIPPRVEYKLTEEGKELHERLDPLLEWVKERSG